MGLRIEQGFAAAALMIADKWRRKYGPDDECRNENDLELFLNNMQYNAQRGQHLTADPAFWYDWIESVGKVVAAITPETDVRLTPHAGWDAVIRFLERYYIEGAGNDVGVGELMREMQSASIPDSDLWQRWLGYVDRASRESPDKLIREWCAEFK